MTGRKAFTLIEILIVLVIIGIIVSAAIPAFVNAIWKSKVQAVENNLRAIAAAQEKYHEDNGSYYSSKHGVYADFESINSHLSLTMSTETENSFNYTCLSSGTCTATSINPPNLAQTVSVDVNGNLTCTGNFNPCP